MKKRLLAVVAALFVCGATSAFATGIGVQGGYNPAAGSAGGAAFTFKLDNVPTVFAADFYFGNAQLQAFGLTADYWVQNPRLAGMVHWYWGPGANIAFYPNTPALDIGGRIFAGINIFPIKWLEIYAQAAWNPHLYMNFNSGNIGDASWWNRWPMNFGVRFWF